MLQRAGVEIAVASITYSFAVSWFAHQLGIRYFLGTALLANGAIGHVWGRDKASWFARLANDRRVPQDRLAAVGDSAIDADLLCVAAIRVFVGAHPPSSVSALIHLPGADLRTVAERVLHAWVA